MSAGRTVARLSTLAVLALSAACGGPAPSSAPASAPAQTPVPLLHAGPLTDYVAAAGLRWMIVGSPRRLAENAHVQKALAVLIPPERFDRFARGTGVDLRRTPTALVAGFDFATLYMVVTPGPNEQIEHLFVDRLLSGAVERQPHPQLRRISGVVGTTPQTMVRIEPMLVAVSVGDPTPARVVEAYARGKLKKSPAALNGAALRTLPFEMVDAAARFYAPGPFEGEWASGARGLLSTAVALGITADLLATGQVLAKVFVTGDFRQALPDPRTQLLTAWKDLSQSSLGKLIGLNQPVSEPLLAVADDLLSLQVTLELEPITRGLHAAVAADVWQLMDLAQPVAPSR